MNKYRYRVVDVFTQTPMQGNPLAVFPDAVGLDDATMQAIAKELNLSETVFVFPATREDCAARVRIFTPGRELAFAGHPTVGASYVLRDENIVPKDAAHFVLEENVGPVPIDVEAGLIWLTTPPIHFGPKYDRAACAQSLGLAVDDVLDCDPQVAYAGPQFLFIPLRTREAVDRAQADAARFASIRQDDNRTGLFPFTPVATGAYSRMFATDFGIMEDPATGGATGPLAAYMIANKLVSGADGTRFVSEQGVKMGRRSLLHVRINGADGVNGIQVGGYVTPLVEAVMTWAAVQA